MLKYCIHIQYRCPMYFLIVRRRERGVAIPPEQLRKAQALRGQIQIKESHCAELGRSTTTAWVFSPAPGEDIIPRLLDVRVTGMAQNGMSLTGLENVDGAIYAQSWWCRSDQ